MPGTSGGTGNPLTFRCAKCKVGRKWDSDRQSDIERGTHIKSTGFRRKRFGGRGPRIDHVWQYEYECLDCGHRGWSRHHRVSELWQRWVAGLGKSR